MIEAMSDKKVSIVCAAYNCSKYLTDTIQSVLDQSYKNWELIIVNDCSEDNTLKVAKAYAEKDDRIKVLSNRKNLGPAATRNKGIEVAVGQFLTFLDGDDLWKPQFIEKSLDYSLSNGYAFVFASYERVDEELNALYKPFIVPTKISYEGILKTCPISCLTAFLHIEKIGKYYMPDIEKRQDYGLWLSILKKVEFAYGIKEPVAIYRIRKGSVSRNKYKAMLYVWKIYRDVEKIGPLKSLYLIVVYAYNGLKKYFR